MPDFLLEVGLEEVPARMIAAAQAELARRVEELLARERLLGADHEVHSYSTPRRLAVLVKGVAAAQAEMEEQLTGPSWKVAFKDGEPAPAAHAFAKKAGVDVSALAKVTTPKGEYVAATAHRKGRAAAEILAEQLPKELAALYWPKNMYWRAGKPERFVRPVKWLLALLDHAIVPVEFAGVHAANLTYGHRILHGVAPLTIEHAGDYLGALEAAHVTADVELRRHRIRKGLDAATRSVPGARWREDEALVDTVTHLTEWPTVLLGGFEADYLSLPEEVLVTVMRDHQKYFAVEDAQGKLAPYFLTVLNTQPAERADEIIRHGNERVLRARFNDARFFWNFDQRIPLENRVEMLKSVTFQKELGSYWDKTEANLNSIRALASTLSGVQFDYPALEAAARLAKTDLTSELVKEFTELQGVVGGLYARHQGLGDAVASAIYWQYQPASFNDPIPPTREGQILGIADRMNTIVSMFSIGLEPTGSKDPFALRRAGNAVVKILAESELPLKIQDLEFFISVFLPKPIVPMDLTISQFLEERVEFYLQEAKRIPYDVVRAVLTATKQEDSFEFAGISVVPQFFAGSVSDAVDRARALTDMRDSDDFLSVCAAFKRMKNILKQAKEKGEALTDRVLTGRFSDMAESELEKRSGLVKDEVEKLSKGHRYREALEQIATLRPHVDLFFDKVMVMVDDPAVRQNRLALIAMVLGSFSSIADFSEIVTG
ncbi:MAG: glycine--tRNA ligase subunit beta [Acidobacteriaceae bacterium]